MMHYQKGESVEHELRKESLPFADCMPKSSKQNFLWMHVKNGTKVTNVMTYAKNALDKGEFRSVVWSSSGGGVVKTISCAEILKRSHPLYQVSRMAFTTVEEHWLPKKDGLEEVIARRKIPSLHILMSLDPIDAIGVQPPNTKTDFWVDADSSLATASSTHTQYQPRLGQKQRQRRPRERPPRDEDRSHQQQQQTTSTPPHAAERQRRTTSENQQRQQKRKKRTD